MRRLIAGYEHICNRQNRMEAGPQTSDPLSPLAPIRSPTVSGVPAEKANSLQ